MKIPQKTFSLGLTPSTSNGTNKKVVVIGLAWEYGWDGWAPKDLSMIMNKAAIQFKVYSTGGKIAGLPLAAAMEDYAGKAAWIGFAGKYISYKNDETWATVTLPIGDFDWDMFDADPSNVKTDAYSI